MFKQMVEDWRTARGAVLRREVEDALPRIVANGPAFQTGVQLVIAQTLVEATGVAGGDLRNLSDRGRIKLGRQIKSEGRKQFDHNMVAGYGRALFGVWLEALSTPGADAERVRTVMGPWLDAGIELMDAGP